MLANIAQFETIIKIWKENFSYLQPEKQLLLFYVMNESIIRSAIIVRTYFFKS